MQNRVILFRGHLRDLINQDSVRERKRSQPRERTNAPRFLPPRETQPEGKRNVRIVHKIHRGSNLFVLTSNSRKRHVWEGRYAQDMYNLQ